MEDIDCIGMGEATIYYGFFPYYRFDRHGKHGHLFCVI